MGEPTEREREAKMGIMLVLRIMHTNDGYLISHGFGILDQTQLPSSVRYVTSSKQQIIEFLHLLTAVIQPTSLSSSVVFIPTI